VRVLKNEEKQILKNTVIAWNAAGSWFSYFKFIEMGVLKIPSFLTLNCRYLGRFIVIITVIAMTRPN